MGKRGKRSAADLLAGFPRVDGARGRLRPPADLDHGVKRVFTGIVAACPPDHFVASDTPLLIEYVRAVTMAERASVALRNDGPVLDGRPSPWITIQEKQVRAMTALSMRLRLSPQARMRPETLSRHARGPRPSVYDGLEVDDV